MNKLDFEGKNIAIVGFGIEGISTIEYLRKLGVGKITVLDTKTKDELEKDVLEKLESLDVDFYGGIDYLEKLPDYEVIIRSPGIKSFEQRLLEAKSRGSIVTSHTKIFLENCPCPVIGVTGTKGKGTTSTLIHEMLKKEGFSAFLGGNIGTPPLTFIDELTSDCVVVLEMSSFQLQDVTISPHIAVILMMVPEHLDYHVDMEEYVEAKRNILRFQKQTDFAVLNKDYIPTRESDLFTDAKVFCVGRENSVDDGCFVKDKAIWIKANGKEEKIIDISEIALPGAHNWENASAAAMAAYLAGASIGSIKSVLKEFKGLPHRLELVATVKGVRYYDDSFSTTPETAIAAIEAFSEPKILILGGSSKNSDFTELGNIISSNNSIKAIIGIGQEWGRIKAEIRGQGTGIRMIEGCQNMQEVVEKAAEIGEIGDVVLLSPACASFGMFKNYKDRGNQFKEEVENLVQ